ncbi:facilitated trehalose transporter Tret1 [Hermetia illucens]|nr:facilitated trehalose transporter Tret1 [Hermetia illucens]XP_037917655.1 facilitated trehalose transporter Tret1 [Hermetia illucens]XP_037917656.1 facilitated trehalose transporter Tret1 [Hermetia illucens]
MTNHDTDRKGSYIPANQKDVEGCELFEIISTKRGIWNQIILSGAVLIVAAGCGMPIGYSAVLLPQLYNTSDLLQMDVQMGSWFASIHSLATPFGSLVSGWAADRVGRRTALLIASIPILAGWTTLATAQSHALLLIGRVVAGIGVGLVGAPAQILIAEIALPRIRGMLIGAPFISYSMGILLVYTLGSQLHWRLVAWLSTVLPILGTIALFFTPESPTWLARKGLLEKATSALTWLRGEELLAKRELDEILRRLKEEKTLEKSKEPIGSPILKSLIIINAFNFLQILSGTFLVVFYAVDIISEIGAHFDNMTAAIMTAVVRLGVTVIFCILLFVMRRRSMVLLSGLGSGVSALALGFYLLFQTDKTRTSVNTWITAGCIFLYIAFNTGFMILPGIMVGELLPAKIRGSVSGYVFAAFNIILFGVTKVFPYLQITLKTYGLFIMFGTASFIASLLMYLMLPETKNLTLGQIEDHFRSSSWLWITRKSRLKS